MSTKKSFSIPTGLATGLRTSIQSATTNHGQLHYDMMSIDIIEPDPENPRKLSITRDELFNGVNKLDMNYEKKIRELEALNDLAASIKKVGIRNAIEVYKEDSKYKIISGERRYLAAILAGQKYVPARINQKLDELKLRYIQWVENINRQDLSLWEKYNNLVTMAAAYTKTNSNELNAEALKELLGVSDTQSYRYLCLLNAGSDVIALVKSGKLNNLKLIQEIASVKNKQARKQVLDDIQNSVEGETTVNKFKKLKDKKSADKSHISLGKVSNLHTAKYLAHTILRDSKLSKYQTKFGNVDWSSVKAVNKAFKDLLKTVEKELLNVKETADEI
ncbi:MAG: ParB/RepB/Spo0J family partition protein [Gammaproteobacteria bacterium]